MLQQIVNGVKPQQKYSGLTEKSGTALRPLFFFHDSKHVARTRLEMRQIERLGVEPSQNRHERDSGLADQRVFVIFEFKNLKIEV
jgi:hypothetical protein